VDKIEQLRISEGPARIDDGDTLSKLEPARILANYYANFDLKIRISGE